MTGRLVKTKRNPFSADYPSSTDRPIEILDWMDARSIAELIIDDTRRSLR